MAWMERLVSAVQSSAAWNTAAEKQAVLAIFEEAKEKYENIAKLGQ